MVLYFTCLKNGQQKGLLLFPLKPSCHNIVLHDSQMTLTVHIELEMMLLLLLLE